MGKRAVCRWLCGLAVVASSACGYKGPRLGDPQNLAIQVDLFGASISGSAGCLVLSDSATAIVNGEVPPAFFRGRSEGWYGCSWPGITFPVGAAETPETTITFEDGSARVSASFLDLGAPMSVTLVPPADGHIRVGSTVGVRWTPTSESLRNESWSFVTAVNQDGSQTRAQIDTASFQGGQGSFTVPAGAQPGPTALEFIGSRSPGVAACEGFEYCGGASIPLELSPIPFQIEP